MCWAGSAGWGLWRDHVPNQFEPQQGLTQGQQAVFHGGGQGQQLGPAPRQPGAVIGLPRLGPWRRVHGRILQPLQGVQHLVRQVAQVPGHDQAWLWRQVSHLAQPQTVAALARVQHLKAVQRPRPDVQQAGARPFHFFQPHAAADGLELLGWATGLVHLAAPGEGDHAKVRALAFAFANHLQVTQLEYLQGQQAARKHGGAQREQRQGFGTGRGLIGREGRAAIIARARRLPMIYQMASLVLDVIAGLLAGTCLLRMAMQAQRIPFNQPLGKFVFAMTDWIVMPLRKLIPPWSRWDLSSLAAAWLIKLLQYLLLWLMAGGHGQLGLLPLVSLVGLLQLLVSALSALVLVYALMSWMQPHSYFMQMADRLVQPWLDPVRRVVPLIGGVDLAPLVLLLVLQLAGMLLAGLQASWMY